MTADYPSIAARHEPSIIELASRPDTDPCDIACDAMPGYVLGDLTKLETAWVYDHTENCRYCGNMLERFEEVDSALTTDHDAFGQQDAVTNPPSAAHVLGLKEARYGFMDTELGPLIIVTSDTGVCDISYLEHGHKHDVLRHCEERGILAVEQQGFVRPAIDQLGEYFAHQRTQFSLPIDLHGVSPFTRSVLEVTNHVPYGHVVTYGKVAAGIGKPGASRAVGNALGRNPLPIVVPCHRVIKSDGAMGWYTGGPHLKHKLLDIEGVRFNSPKRVDQQVLGL